MMKIKEWLGFVAMAALMIGCGESGPKLVSVTGTVSLNGQPVEGAALTFEPDPTDPHREARPGEAVTDAAGKYEVSTSLKSGLAPGKYRVMVTKAPLDAAKGDPTYADDPYMAQLSATGLDGGKKAKKSVIEQTFDRDVPEAGSTLDFDLKAAK